MKYSYYIVFILLAFCVELIRTSDVNCTSNNDNIELCSNGNYIIISTVDGMITALDIKTGRKCWSTILDTEKFLSSTLSELEIYENGRRIWLVPSLDGSLFKYDKFKLLPLPVDVDILLSHSAFLDASTSVYGGKVKIIFGIDRLTGEIIYSCKVEGCEHLKNTLPQNILVVEEVIQVVNAIEPSQAEKKWHFRVVELNLKLTSRFSTNYTSEFHNDSEKNALIPTRYKELQSTSFNKEFINFDAYKISLQNGFAGKIDKTSPGFLWLHKAACPINDAWYIEDNIVEILDPFHEESGFFSIEDEKHSLLLFLGIYENQMFIKKSRQFPLKNMGFNSLAPNVLYKTYSFPVCPKANDLIISGSSKEAASFELDFNDYGSYFYMNFSIAENTTHCIINASYIMNKEDKLKLSYWFGLMSTVISVTLLVVSIAIFQVAQQEKNKEHTNGSKSSLELQVSEKETNPENNQEFKSRFHQDFDMIEILGKGGFGVVMDVKNKIDDCRYAVKRICLQEQLYNSQYERVLREVKALAKLDHHGIVRYFNAWIEYPPLGWQEKQDEESHICDVSVESITSPCSPDCSRQQNVSKNGYGKKLNQNPFQPFGDYLFDDINNKINNNQVFSKSTNSDDGSDLSETISWQSSSCSKKDLKYPYENGVSHSSCDNSSLSNGVSSKKPSSKENYSKNSTSDFSVAFLETTKSYDNGFSPHSNFIISDTSQDVYSNNSDSIGGIYFQVELPEEHLKCYEALKIINNSLAKSMDLDTFDSFCNYVFHDSTTSSISIIEKSDWKSFISSYASSKKKLLFCQQWLICILCLTRSSKEFDCKEAKCNFCYMLWDVNRILDDPYFMQQQHLLDSDTISSESSLSELSSHSSSINEDFNNKSKNEANKTPNSSLLKNKPKEEKKVVSGYLYIQMQLCQKESLHDWLTRNSGYREYQRVMEIFFEIIDAVDYVHNCGLMHRDLKPSNIYFSLEGAIKIGDFGLATSAEIQGKETVSGKEFSRIHTCDIGTEFYMSPEQKLKQHYDYKTDIYSLGIILFELLVPFNTYSERYQVLLKVKHLKFPPEFEKKFSNESELVKQLLDVDPNKRPTTGEIKTHPLFLNYSSSPK